MSISHASSIHPSPVSNVSYINKEAEQYNHSTSLKRKKTSNTTNYTSHGKSKPKAAEPLSIEDVRKLRNYFLNESNQSFKYRNYMYVVLSINAGRRCSDILKLTIGDVYNPFKNIINNKFYITETKTGKTTRYGILINDDMKSAIKLYLTETYINNNITIDPSEYLFKSRKHGFHITKESAWEIFTTAKKILEINTKGGTHGLRKTYGMKFFEDSGRSPEALYMLMRSFNHSSPEQTADYLTLNQNKIDSVVSNFSW